MCHHPVNFKSQPQGVNFSFPFVANTPIPEKTGSGIEVRLTALSANKLKRTNMADDQVDLTPKRTFLVLALLKKG